MKPPCIMNRIARAAALLVLPPALLATALLFSSQQRLASQSAVVPCEPVNAPWDGALVIGCSASPGGVCAAGTIGSGPLKGTTATVYYGSGASAGMPNVEPATTFSYSGIQVIHTDKGDLYASAVGVADSRRHLFTEISRITGGTGRFLNATGSFSVSGTLSPDGISFQSRIAGEICFDRTSP